MLTYFSTICEFYIHKLLSLSLCIFNLVKNFFNGTSQSVIYIFFVVLLNYVFKLFGNEIYDENKKDFRCVLKYSLILFCYFVRHVILCKLF